MKRKTRKPKAMGFSPAEVKAAKAAQAQAEGVTPQAVIDAFAPEPVLVGGFTLQPCYGTTIILLKKVAPSLLATDKSEDFNLEDLFRALVIFTRPSAEMRALVAAGKHEALAQEIADVFPPANIPRLAKAINAQIVTAFSTLVPHGAKGEGEGSGNFPVAAAAPGTAGS